MTGRGEDVAAEEFLSRVFYDIAQVLGSAKDSEARVVRVLEHLRSLVPYQACAVLVTEPGRDPHLVAAPGTPASDYAGLLATTTALLSELGQERGPASGTPSIPGMHLAVPLVGLDEVVGVLFVRDADRTYNERHVRRLSVVAAKLAAYFSMLRASTLEAERTQQIDAARRAAETANRAKDEFLALVSHELRTPLNTILVWADALRSKDTPDAVRARALEAIERSVRAETKLIEDLLDLSCIANATLRLDVRAVDPAELIEATLRTLRPRAEQKSLRLDAALDGSVTPLFADRGRLSQIFTNLVANAIKFTPDGGRIQVRLERTGTLARFQVLDSGPGISPALLPNLFERFRTADSSITRTHRGLGVGLALVKDLVELHGGHVRAESPGEYQGATFIVELPLAGAAGTAASAGGHPDPRTLAGIRVLLVDDDQDVCDVLRFILETEGAVVTVAVSVAEALAALDRFAPDVLLSDIAMPGASGHDLMRNILARHGAAAPPAAAVTAYALGQSLEQALASGFRMLLVKPVEPKALITAVLTLAKAARSDGVARRRVESGRP